MNMQSNSSKTSASNPLLLNNNNQSFISKKKMIIIIMKNNNRTIIRETRVSTTSTTTIIRRNLIGLDMSSCGINPQIHIKNRLYNDHLSTTLLSLENDKKKKKRVCMFDSCRIFQERQ
jgi:hypothetical protein